MNFINLNILELYHPVMAKCPHCKDVINLSQLITEEFEDGDLLFKFLGLSCPRCEVLLKIQKIDWLIDWAVLALFYQLLLDFPTLAYSITSLFFVLLIDFIEHSKFLVIM